MNASRRHSPKYWEPSARVVWADGTVRQYPWSEAVKVAARWSLLDQLERIVLLDPPPRRHRRRVG